MNMGQARILATLLATKDNAYDSPSNGSNGTGGSGSGRSGRTDGKGAQSGNDSAGGDKAMDVTLSDRQVLNVLQQLIAALTAMLTGSKVIVYRILPIEYRLSPIYYLNPNLI